MVLRPARVDRDHRRQPPRLPHLDPLRGERRRQELRSERGRHQRPPHAGSLEPRRNRDSAARGRAVRGVEQRRTGRGAAGGHPRSRRDDRSGARTPAADGSPRRRLRRVGEPDRRSAAGRARPVRGVLPLPPGRQGAGLARRGALGRAASAEHAGQLRALDPRGRARAARPLRGPRPRPARKPPPDRPPRPGGCARGDRTAARALEPRPGEARRGGGDRAGARRGRPRPGRDREAAR